MTNEELIEAIDNLEEQMFLEQMKDYMDHVWYYSAFLKLRELKSALLTQLAETETPVLLKGKKYRIVKNEKEKVD